MIHEAFKTQLLLLLKPSEVLMSTKRRLLDQPLNVGDFRIRCSVFDSFFVSNIFEIVKVVSSS